METMDGNDICISGIAGHFPESDSVKELAENMFKKVDLITEDERRWKHTNPEIPKRGGRLKNISDFDASFFGISYQYAHVLEPMTRLALERVYECLIDAGINPSELRNTNTAVVVGSAVGETEAKWLNDYVQSNSYGISGCTRSSLQNHVSEWLGVSGPCYIVDTACSSSLFALEQSFKMIRDGQCDSAIVVGVNLTTHPWTTLCFARLGVLSPTGSCKSFDESGDGYVRSESIVACFVQKVKDARRIHARLIHAKTNCDGYKEQGITYPAGQMQELLLTEFYKECGITPSTLEYIEAHGTGTRVGDPEELRAIDNIFCPGRTEPLMIGSIKSNLGHSEPSSGCNSIAKLCIAYNTGYIPPNINFKTPRQAVPALTQGRLKVVTEKQPWNRGLASVSSFGFGGANAHILMTNTASQKVNNGLPSDSLPRLVCVSGRTESAVAKILDDLESRPVDVDEVRLWHAIHEHDIKEHYFRGFVLLGSTPTKSVRLSRDIQHYSSDTKRSVVFKYSSLGLHWSATALQLMKIPIFANALQRCHAALETEQINLFSLIYSNSQVLEWHKYLILIGNVAVQIGLTDILKAVGIVPDRIISPDYHELLRNYADGSLSAEQTILKFYKMSLASGDAFELQKAKTSAPKVEKSTDRLTNGDISGNLSSNTIVIDMGICGHTFEELVQKDVTIVTLVEENMKDIQFLFEALGRLFEAGLNLRIANLYPTVPFPVPQSTPMLSHLVEWNHKGCCRDAALNSLSDIIKVSCNERTVQVSIKREETEYMAGHTIDGRIIFPATGYLFLVWETFAALTGRDYTEVSVVFSEVYFLRATNIPKDGTVTLTISLQRGSGCFEVLENGMSVVTGYISEYNKVGDDFRVIPEDTNETDPEQKILLTKDFYKELNLRGYQYKGLFRGLESSNIEGTRGSLKWNHNWVSFLDTMLQVNIVANDTRSLYVPTRIEKFSIDVDLHERVVSQAQSRYILKDHSTLLEFRSYPYVGATRSGGVEIRGLHVTAISKKPPLGIPVYEKNCFIPNYNNHNMTLEDAIRANIQLIMENIQAYKFKSIELVDTEYTANELQPIIEEVGDVLADLPLVRAELLVLSEESIKLSSNVNVANKKLSSEVDAVLLIGANLLKRQNVLVDAYKSLKSNGFILSRENTRIDTKDQPADFQIITVFCTGSEYLVLLRKKVEPCTATYIEVLTQDSQYSWIDKVKTSLNEGKKVVLYNQNEPINGLLGLVNCLRKEPDGANVTGLLIADSAAPTFDASLPLYNEQLSKGLAINVYKNGKWGTYRHLLLEEQETKPIIHAHLKQSLVGDLSTLQWLEGPLSTDSLLTSSSRCLVHVYYSAMNFRDVMTATGRVQIESVARGRLAQDCVQGIEVSGKTSNGSRVMAICEKGISNLIETEESLIWCVPDEWSLAEAATVPVAYSTVYMALVMVGKICRGESILIHAGSGAVGQAAINIALHHGLEVFTTVGTPAKRAFIKRLFPKIKDSHIGNSRDTTFEDMIRRETDGRGVNLVLNSLADDKLQASVKCLSKRGRFLEIGKYDIFNNTKLETCFLKKEISFHGIMLDFISDEASDLLRKGIRHLVMRGIMSGAVKPITYCVFEKDEIQSAFRYMAAGKHIGKVIIKIREEEPRNCITKPKFVPIEAFTRYMCNANCVYVLVGGLGGFGLELADWLVLRGARKLVFSSRRGVSNGYQALRLKIWKSYGTEIEIFTQDVTTEAGCETLLKLAAAMGPVRAIFNLAVILKDAVFQNQTPETFQESFGPKARATMHLDKYSRTLCPKLRDFVIFSSVSCGRGNAGQTNYGFSNSVMERICEERKNLGLPALAIQWGAIGDVGLVADMQEEDIQLEIGGTLQQRISSCLQAMDKFMKQDATIVSSIVVAEKRTGGVASGSIIEVIAQIIGIGDLKTVSRQVPLSEMGMDSVMAVEIKQTLERDYEIFLSAQEIRMLTFAKLLQFSSSEKQEISPAETKIDINAVGLKILMKNFGDEKTVSEPYIYLPTLVSETEENGADKNKILFLLPGLESCAETFRVLSSMLKIKTCALQLGLNYVEEDVKEMSSRMYKIVREKLSPGDSFYLLGYSFGSLVILELAAKLENDGYKGIVFCLDGSPDFCSELAEKLLKKSDDFQLQNNLICHILNMVQPKEKVPREMMTKLNSITAYDDKIKCAIEMNPGILDHSDQFLTSMAIATLNRIKQLWNYNFSNYKKISSPIVLLRQNPMPFIFKSGENYGLDKFTSSSVTVHYLDGDHNTIVDNPKCAEIINETVSKPKVKCIPTETVNKKIKTRQVGNI